MPFSVLTWEAAERGNAWAFVLTCQGGHRHRSAWACHDLSPQGFVLLTGPVVICRCNDRPLWLIKPGKREKPVLICQARGKLLLSGPVAGGVSSLSTDVSGPVGEQWLVLADGCQDLSLCSVENGPQALSRHGAVEPSEAA